MTNLSYQLAKDFRDVHFGENWTSVNLKESLAGIIWEMAVAKTGSFNTIATLVYHTGYYVRVLQDVIEGRPLNAKDAWSFKHPPIESAADWEKLLDETWINAENTARLIEQLPESKLWEIFIDEKYGTYYRNILGITEHLHYHLGQIVLLKKMLIEAGEK